MTEEMQQIPNRKLERRKQLAALPVGEKLRMLKEMVAVTRAVNATRLPKPPHRVPADPRVEQAEECGPHGPPCG